MSKFSSTPRKLQPLADVPKADDTETQNAVKKKSAEARKRKGFSASVKTGSLGVAGNPNTERTTLLGA